MSADLHEQFRSIGVPPMGSGYSRGFPSARRRCYSRAFTLIEMLVATVLSAVLISAVLQLLAGVSRDRRMLNHLNAIQPQAGITELVRWDLANAQSVVKRGNDLVLTGVDGIDPTSLSPNGRLVQVRYQLESRNLWRVQEYIDDAAHPGIWHELVAVDVSDFSMEPATESASQMRLRLISNGESIDQKLWVK